MIIYNGRFTNDEMTGIGVFTIKDSTRYEGIFEKGILNGQCTVSYPDSSIYQGECKENVRSGMGELTYKDRRRYKGQFVNGIFMERVSMTLKTGQNIPVCLKKTKLQE